MNVCTVDAAEEDEQKSDEDVWGHKLVLVLTFCSVLYAEVPSDEAIAPSSYFARLATHSRCVAVGFSFCLGEERLRLIQRMDTDEHAA